MSLLPTVKEGIADQSGKIVPAWYRFLAKIERLIIGATTTPGTGLTTSTSGALTIANDGVSNAMLRESVPLSVIGNPDNITRNVDDIAAGGNERVLQRTGDQLVFGYVKLASFTVATAPTASNNDQVLIFVSNEVGGATVAFSDGAGNWRRVQDRAIIA